MDPSYGAAVVEICGIIILVYVYRLKAARWNLKEVAVRRSAAWFRYLQMHDRNTLRSSYTSLSFCPARTMSALIALLQRPSERPAARSIATARGSPQDQHRSEYRSLAVIRNPHAA